MWKELITDPEVTKYFPDYSEKHFPNKTFLMIIINTVRPIPRSIIYSQISKYQKSNERTIKRSVPLTIKDCINSQNAYLNLLKEFECLG